MKKTKKLVVYFMLFILGLITAIFIEDNFHKIVRQLYRDLTANKIVFDIQKLDIYFFSVPFILSAGFYFVFLLYFFTKQTRRQKVTNSILTIIFLASSVYIFCYLDSNFKLVECTACNDGIRVLNYSDIDYTKIFLCGLFTSIIPSLWTEIKTRKQKSSEMKANR